VYEARHIHDESFLLLLVAGISPVAIVLPTNETSGKLRAYSLQCLDEMYYLSGITIPSFPVLPLCLGGGLAVA
jgi:hypothetical protein